MAKIKEYVERVLKVLVYIEAHIDEEMTTDELARVACYSVFHFHRIFQAIIGETLNQYVKRLRMEQAAARLRYTDMRVTDIALDASYDTPSAFTKAFKQFIGKSPKSYRTLYTTGSILPNKIKELRMIQPDKIEKISDLNLLFIRRYGNYMKSPWEAWKAMAIFLDENHLDRSQLQFFGIIHDGPEVTNEDKLRYDACILAPKEVREKGEVGKQILKGGKYAIFTHIGAYEKMDETFTKIFLKWLPESSENFDDARTPFCEYFNREYVKTDPDKLITKIYVPLA